MIKEPQRLGEPQSTQISQMMKKITICVICVICGLSYVSCEQAQEHMAPAINDRDSASAMISYGVNTLISDSGVIKYRIVTERWDINTVRQPTRWTP